MRVTSPPLNEKQKAYLRRSNGVKTRWAVDGTPLLLTPVRNKDREFNAPTKLHGLKARRGRCVLSHEKRSIILDRALQRSEMRTQLEAIIEGAKRDAEKARDFLRGV